MGDLKNPSDIHTPEKFKEYVDTLEVARQLLEADTPARVRLALIVLDGAAEIFMYRLCSDLFRSDEFHSRVLPPRFSRRRRAQVLWKFPEKIRLLKAEGVLNGSDAAVLDAAHSYRNQAAHHDTHNPRGGRAIAALMLGAVGRLFAAAGAGVMMGGFRDGEIDWLGRYGLPTGHIEFSAAALKIAGVLSAGLPTDVEDVRGAMLNDLGDRLEALATFPQEYLYGPSDADLAEMLRLEEFYAGFDEEAVAAEYREAVYAIAGGVDYSPEEYRRREAHYKKSLQAQREQFRATLRLEELRCLPEWLARVESASTIGDLVEAYVLADRRITAYESALTSAALRLDSAIQFQIDLERGK